LGEEIEGDGADAVAYKDVSKDILCVVKTSLSVFWEICWEQAPVQTDRQTV